MFVELSFFSVFFPSNFIIQPISYWNEYNEHWTAFHIHTHRKTFCLAKIIQMFRSLSIYFFIDIQSSGILLFGIGKINSLESILHFPNQPSTNQPNGIFSNASQTKLIELQLNLNKASIEWISIQFQYSIAWTQVKVISKMMFNYLLLKSSSFIYIKRWKV